MPRNWLRALPYTPAADENLFEITLTVAGFAHQLVVYTHPPARTRWTRPSGPACAHSITDQPIGVTIRALTLSGAGTVSNPPSAPATADFTIAPVDAPESTGRSPTVPADILRGFGIGEEGVEDVLVASQLVAPTITTSQSDSCIQFCRHAGGQASGSSWGPTTTGRTATTTRSRVSQTAPSAKPGNLGDANQLAMLRSLRGIPAYSRGHWTSSRPRRAGHGQPRRGDALVVNLDTDGAEGTISANRRLGRRHRAELQPRRHADRLRLGQPRWWTANSPTGEQISRSGVWQPRRRGRRQGRGRLRSGVHRVLPCFLAG